MLQMLLPWSKKQSPRPRKSLLLAGPVWSWVVALAFRRVYPVPVWNVRRKMFVDEFRVSTASLPLFQIKFHHKYSPHVALGVEPLNILNHGSWLQPNRSSRSLVAARLDATVYALDTEQLTLDRALDSSVVLWKTSCVVGRPREAREDSRGVFLFKT